MARAEAKGMARYLPTAVQSIVGIAALSAIVSGAAIQRRRRRMSGATGAGDEQSTVWATSGTIGPRQGRDD